MNIETLETERLLLRGLTPDVYKYAFHNLNSQELKKFFGCATDADLEEERKKYNEGLSMYRKSFFVFQLRDKRRDTVIGWCGYHTWYLLHMRAEIGYIITDNAYRKKGLMKEALPLVLHYGFNSLGLQRVEAFIAPDNVPSLKLVHSLGFVQEGRLREHYLVEGHFDDSLVFSLLKREYQQALAPGTKHNHVLYKP